MKVYSKSVDSKGVLVDVCSAGSLLSPHLKWDPVPHAKSYAVTIVDHHANSVVGCSYIHWAVTNIKETELVQGAASEKKKDWIYFENSSSQKNPKDLLKPELDGKWASNYSGPFPPNKDHVYDVVVFALDTDFDSFKTKNVLFFDDFETLIANHVIDVGFFYFVGRHMKYDGNECVMQPAKIDSKFWAKETVSKITNIKVDGSSKPELSAKYFTSFDPKTNKYNYPSTHTSPQVEWDGVPSAKSYVFFLNNSAQVKAWKLPSVNWVVGPVAADSNPVLVPANATRKSLKEAKNSYRKTDLFFKSFLSPQELDKAENLSAGFTLIHHPESDLKNGFYTLFVYATDLDVASYPPMINNEAELLEVIKGHVVGLGMKKLKIK